MRNLLMLLTISVSAVLAQETKSIIQTAKVGDLECATITTGERVERLILSSTVKPFRDLTLVKQCLEAASREMPKEHDKAEAILLFDLRGQFMGIQCFRVSNSFAIKFRGDLPGQLPEFVSPCYWDALEKKKEQPSRTRRLHA